MTAARSHEPSQAEIQRGAAVLLYLLTWQEGFDNDKAVLSLRAAKLDAVIVLTPSDRPRVHEGVLKAFCDRAGKSAVWDGAVGVWRARRKGDTA